ncbi:MAG: NAD-dependent epimerase/dehydratase family protein, partial [Gemmatimonadales bacterium]|nr:NAD-dependent epimerase/dehydratase family protein [Gemmatimonadales bacterium]
NTVGPRQTGSYGMVIPRFVGQALRDQPITVFGDGSQTRCFCHVIDIIEGLVALSEHADAMGRVFNLGGREEISIASLAQRIVDLTGSESKVEFIPYDEAYEEGFEDMARRVPNTSRAGQLVGFEPSIGLDDIIRSVVADQQA